MREVRRAGGERIFEAKCQSSSAECLADVSATCPDGHTILDSESHAGGTLADVLPGPVTWYQVVFKCGGNGGEERATFPHRGAYVVQ